MANLYRCENKQLLEKRNDSEHEKKEEKKPSSPKKKIDFKSYKNNTVKSLNEVEHFLRNFRQFSKYIKLYKILK